MAGKVFRRQASKDTLFFEVEKEDGDLLRFDCRSSIPGGVILSFSELIGGTDGDATDAEQLAAGKGALKIVHELFKAAILKGQQALFWSMVNGDAEEGFIDIEQLMQIAMYLGEAYAARPTGVPSSDGSPKTSSGSPSRDGAPPAAQVTYSRLTPVESSTSSSIGLRDAVQ